MASSPQSVSGPLHINTEPIFSNRTLVVINVATRAPLKLPETTYFPWKTQFDALLIGYDLYGFIDGTLSCPSPLLLDNTPNPDFSFWVRQDSLLLSAILAFLSRDVHRFVFQIETSKEAWHKLALILPNLFVLVFYSFVNWSLASKVPDLSWSISQMSKVPRMNLH